MNDETFELLILLLIIVISRNSDIIINSKLS